VRKTTQPDLIARVSVAYLKTCSSQAHCLCCTDWDARRRTWFHLDGAARCSVQIRRKANDAAAGTDYEWTNAERRTVPAQMIGEGLMPVKASRIDVVVSTLPNVDDAEGSAEEDPVVQDVGGSVAGRISKKIGK